MVDIVLATFNGENFIEEQIRSIQAQSEKSWRLIVHDDGSNDNTITIIKDFCKEDSRIFLVEDGMKFGNPGANFMHTLRYSTAEYVMFCDQDDIWFPHKIRKMLSYTDKWEQNVPSVTYSQSSAWSLNQGVIGKSTFYFPTTLNDFLFFNSGQQGCVSLFNAAMRNKMLLWKGECAMHDHILHMIGMTIGRVSYHQEPLMLYRQHDGNATGSVAVKKTGVAKLLAHSKAPVVGKLHYEDWRKFKEIYATEISDSNRFLIDEYLKMPERNFISKILAVRRNNFMLFGSGMRLMIKILLRPYIS